MSRRAWIFVWFVLISGAVLTVSSILVPRSLTWQWLAFVVLTTAATLAQLLKANAPNRTLYYPNLVFVFAGVLLLHPFLFSMLVIVSYSIEWAKERLTHSPDLRDWYLQPFNIAMVIISGAAARLVLTLLAPRTLEPVELSSVAAGLLAVIAFFIVNQMLLALALVLGRGRSWKEVASLNVDNVQADLIHTLLGYVVAIVWNINPWLVFPTVAPLFLTYRALMVPQLKKDASTDSKTGLWNAGHFTKLLSTELERTKRFGHPLALIVTDLDLLRNVNNTYGHLAGDTVLATIGQIVRSNLRDYDIAARFGGEEFTIALPETEIVEAVAIAERLRMTIEAAAIDVKSSETPIHVTMSFGVASFPKDGTTLNDLIHQADVAVYQAKLKGRNCVVLASEVPHSQRLEDFSALGQLNLPDEPPLAVRGEIAASHAQPGVTQPPKPVLSDRRIKPKANHPDFLIASFVGAVVVVGLVAALVGLTQDRMPDLGTVAVLCVMAALAELYQSRLYGDSTFSVSVAIMFAAALITGVLGVLSVSLAIVLVHFFRNTRIALYKPAFNWATHVLAGFVPLVVFRVFQISLGLENFLPLIFITAATAIAYYIIETGFISTAMGLSERVSILGVWREQFQWTVVYYLALCMMGLFIGVIYSDPHWRIFGLILVAVPISMIYYAQRQYVEQTENGVHELNRLNEELSVANREVINASHAIRQLNEDLLITLSKMIDARDPYVLGHASKVADYAVAIAKEMNFSPQRIERLRQAALLHDIGKIGISEQILNKPGKLTGLEYEKVKVHASLGAELLETSQGLRHLATFVGHHHEWWDGNGYPDRIAGEQISLEARILAVCDAVESMASDRPYQRAKGLKEIIEEIKDKSGTQFDPEVVRVCKRVLEQRGESLVVNSAKQVNLKHEADRENEGYTYRRFFPLKPRSGFAPIAD